jgi:hypothetical protein
MLLGGWMLTDPVDQQNQNQDQNLPTTIEEVMQSPTGPVTDAKDARDRERAEHGRNSRNMDRSIQRNGTPRSSSFLGSQPSAPTDSSASGMQGLPMSPTQSFDEGSQGGNQNFPVAPTALQPSRYRSSGGIVGSSQSVLDQRIGSQYQQTLDSSAYSGQTAEKAFTGQKVFSSGYSPYMGLFRNDTNGGTIDNYTQYVRPALDQQTINQKTNMDIYGLERNARIQNSALQQMNRSPRTLQPIATPQYQNSRSAPSPYSYGYGSPYYGQ